MKLYIARFYKFTNLHNPKEAGKHIKLKAESLELRGTIILAEEGINGTISGTYESLDTFTQYLQSNSLFQNCFQNLDVRMNSTTQYPFKKLKVKIKKEIVTMGQRNADPRKLVGTYLDPASWNQILNDPSVIVIDTRNTYEIEQGTFQGAVDLRTRFFRDFPDKALSTLDPAKHKKIAMFCTGGIRCERASSFLLNSGFQEVYHLKGGILGYLETISSEDSQWKGDCFVFDERAGVNHSIQQNLDNP